MDTSPLYSNDKIRGIGFYTKRLLEGFRELNPKDLVVKELKNKDEIKKADFDILHIPYFQPFFHTLPLIRKFPLVLTIHDLIPIKYPKHYPVGLRGDFFWRFQKQLLRRVDLVITDSFSSKYDISGLAGYPQDRIFVTSLAAGREFKKLEIGNWKLEIKQKYQLPDVFVLNVGDVNWNKNVSGLVRACQKIKIPLVVVGKQAVTENFDRKHPENKDLVWLQNYFENCKLKIGNSKFLNLVGFIPTEDLVVIYNLASVYCQPSFDEGFGLPVLEAMSCGCPVVCSDGGSLPEVAGEAAFVVKPEVGSLASGITEVLKNGKLRAELVRSGIARSQNFSWKKTAQQTLSVYRLLDR
ncbi:MAG: glycosyltransferase family 1 protein [Patescibacteria group bacterium]